MSNQQEIKLSSNWTNIAIYVPLVLILVMTPVLIFISKDQEFHMRMIFAGVIFLALIGFIIYLFIYLCNARIIGDKIVLKKQFRASKSYSFDKIGYPTSFQIKRTKYITIEMKNDDNKIEKYLIMNSKSLLSFENKDAEQELIRLRNLAMSSQN